MPATAGRVRMPHNNRVSTSAALRTNDIWSKTIGHDPYAAKEGESSNATLDAEKARGLLDLARHQNIAAGDGRRDGNDFARKMFLGLKSGKKRRIGEEVKDMAQGGGLDGAALNSSSSSEEEYCLEENITAEINEKKSIKSRRMHRKSGDTSSSSSSDDSSSSSSDAIRKRQRRRRQYKNRHSSRRKKRNDDKKRSDRHRRSRKNKVDLSSDESSVSLRRERKRKRHKSRHNDALKDMPRVTEKTVDSDKECKSILRKKNDGHNDQSV